jgi:two-component system, LytTR family, sensor kinase
MPHVKWYNKKVLVVLLHVCCWILLMGLPFLLRSDEGPRRRPEESTGNLNYLFVVKILVWVGIFYFNAYFIVPKIFYRRRLWTYIPIFLGLLGILLLIDYVFFQLIAGRPFRIQPFLFFSIFPLLFILTASTAFRMASDRLKEDRVKREKETENLKTELSLLRSQVSPHFLFNIMNNMVALARKKSDILESSLIKLSALLRYMLYETDEKVSLNKEIEYLQSYIDLQRQRFGTNVQINTSMPKTDQHYEIEPMLLIPFVENAFKHGTGMIQNAEIDIDLQTQKDILSFSVRNKFNDTSGEIKDKSSGIGLTNVKRRLELLYGGKHSLVVAKQKDWFIVSLQIVLT